MTAKELLKELKKWSREYKKEARRVGWGAPEEMAECMLDHANAIIIKNKEKKRG